MLRKKELKVLLDNPNKKRCKDLELLFKLEDSEIEIYSFDTGKYLVYFSDDNDGVLYDSKNKLMEVEGLEELPDYQHWIDDMKLNLNNLKENLKFPLLANLIGVSEIDIHKHRKKIELALINGKFMKYDPLLYKELLLVTIEYLRKNQVNASFLLESSMSNVNYHICFKLDNKITNLTALIWNELSEPHSGFFEFIQGMPYFYLVDENVRTKDQPEELLIANPVSRPQYQQWISDMQFNVKELEENIKLPLLTNLIGASHIHLERDWKKIELALTNGKFMNYNPLLYKEFLLLTIHHLRESHSYSSILLEPLTSEENYEVYYKVNKNTINLTKLLWDEFFEPHSGFFEYIKAAANF